jgi:hypothetical protein
MFRAVFLPIIRSFSTVHRHWYNLCSSVAECYSQFRPDPGSTRSPSYINCTNAFVWLKSSCWWAERKPETCRIIITNNKIGTQCICWFYSQGICHDARSNNLSRCTVIQSVMMHGHAISHDARSRNLSRCTIMQSVMMHGHAISHDARSCNLSRCTVMQSVTMYGHAICHDARSCNLSRCTVMKSVTMHGHTILKCVIFFSSANIRLKYLSF